MKYLYVHEGETLTEFDRNEIAKLMPFAETVDIRSKSTVGSVDEYDGVFGVTSDGIVEAEETAPEVVPDPVPTPAEPVADSVFQPAGKV